MVGGVRAHHPSESKAKIQLNAGHEPPMVNVPAPDTWVQVTYLYNRVPETASPIAGNAEEAARKKKVLDMSPEEFANDKEAQQELFKMARDMRD